MIFVTGTDTGCGKTTVGRAIAAAMRRRGFSVAVFKPIETGCSLNDEGQLVGEDALALARSAGCALDHALLCPVRLRQPASPERAASAEGRSPLDLEEILCAWDQLRGSADFILVEGAGGLLVPIASDLTMADLARALGLPLVLVSRDALGTVNHTLLTLEAIRARGLPLLGVLFSSTDPSGTTLANVEAVSRHGGVPILGVMPHLQELSDEALAIAAEEHIDLDLLLRPLSLGA